MSAVKTAKVASSVKAPAVAIKAPAVAIKAPAVAIKGNPDKLEGMTLHTAQTGVISFTNSGSNDILNLIAKFGFDKVKVLEAAKKLKDSGKGFLKSDPAKKYTKMAGIIKRLQNKGFKLPKHSV